MPSTTPSLAITWTQPTFLLPLFALCSLLGVTNSLAAAVGLAAATTAALFSALALILVLRPWVPEQVGTAVWLVVGATVIAAIELLMQAHLFELYRALGLFLPLSVTVCLLLARREMLAAHSDPRAAGWAAIKMSAGFAVAAVVVGAARELVGRGSLFHDAGNLLGSWAAPLEVTLFRADMGFLLAALAPGAFIGLGLGVALYNWLWLQYRK